MRLGEERGDRGATREQAAVRADLARQDGVLLVRLARARIAFAEHVLRASVYAERLFRVFRVGGNPGLAVERMGS